MLFLLLLLSLPCNGVLFELEIHAVGRETPLVFTFTTEDATSTNKSLLFQVLDFCLDHRLHKSSPNCESLLFDGSHSLLCDSGHSDFCGVQLSHFPFRSVQENYIDYWWTGDLSIVHKHRMDSMAVFHRDNIAAFRTHTVAALSDTLHHDVSVAHLVMPLNRGEHYIDEHRCLHVFHNVMLSSQPLLTEQQMSAAFGYVNKSTFSSLHGNCSGNILYATPYPGYWKEYNYKHYPNMLPWSASYSEKYASVTYMTQPHIIVYDRIFCHNIAHVLESTSLFWSAISLHNVIRGVHLLYLETDRCHASPLLSFASLMQRAIIHASAIRDIPVYVQNKEFAMEYMSYYAISEDIRYNNVFERSDDTVYATLLDRPYHWHTSFDGLQLMADTTRQLCGCDNNVRNTIVIASRAGSRHIANLEDVINSIMEVFNDVEEASNDKLKWTVHSVDMGSLDVCDQVNLMSQTRVFVCVHGSECALSSFMSSESVIVELHPGCCIDESLGWFYQQLYEAAQLYYTYFTGTYVSNIHCMHYYPGMLTAKYCGTFANITLLRETMHEVKELLL